MFINKKILQQQTNSYEKNTRKPGRTNVPERQPDDPRSLSDFVQFDAKNRAKA